MNSGAAGLLARPWQWLLAGRGRPALHWQNRIAGRQNAGLPASLHDHIRNDVEVRSMAGSVVL